ncbi:hypothetical protein N7510_002417 [Penicillium lagena]|uniref:uncharacterized protein n=1 Tax=Penicillium lagena TaxID=94218 RepID=UPI0025406CC8|nr:uncharacterized protein N7510_002417 [Penicillium lagena]KAJ5626108.1 hypothetical protein N7510_002417 [Penicillium lagena]
MILSRRAVPLLGLCFFAAFFFTARQLSQPWGKMGQVVGMGDVIGQGDDFGQGSRFGMSLNGTWNLTMGRPKAKEQKTLFAPHPHFEPGVPKPPGQEYSKVIVAPRTKYEDTSWMEEELPEYGTAVYWVDDPTAELHVPKNKGHEVMVYLTYIIDNYDDLPDIAVFVHAHQNAWHNDPIFKGDAVEMLKRLNPARVIREGYMNTRCGFGPGCPDWMHPGALVEDGNKQEEVLMARAWAEIFPDDPVPSVLSQPCCAQFAVSGERIRAIPRSRFIFYRDWLLQTDFSDYIAGRVWEYMWQYVFTGKPVLCVDEHICMCDGYGFCFGSDDGFRAYQDLEKEVAGLADRVMNLEFLQNEFDIAEENHDLDDSMPVDPPETQEPGVYRLHEKKQKELNDMWNAAIERGKNPKYRALEAGRPWKEGDGF